MGTSRPSDNYRTYPTQYVFYQTLYLMLMIHKTIQIYEPTSFNIFGVLMEYIMGAISALKNDEEMSIAL